MPIASWSDIRNRALAFSKDWSDASKEKQQASPFLIDFLEVFGRNRKRTFKFEHNVKKYGGKQGYVDLFLPGELLIEMKSRGESLKRAFDQAVDYFEGIADADLPAYVLVCDFATFSLTNIQTAETITFPIADLHKHIKLFAFLAGYKTQTIKPQDPINIKAAEKMGKLHDQLKAIGYEGHQLEVYLVRLLFCLFAEDTSIFEKRIFQDYIENRTNPDGTDLAYHLVAIFQTLNTPEIKRLKNIEDDLAAFPYVNGKLFEETLPIASFDRAMRQALLDACALDWSAISPAIFGSLFQSIMDSAARRNLGAHYTSEENILKLIKPLFLDALWAEFEQIGNNKKKLATFHDKLGELKFLDPACGCGNFLVIAYRELRQLEFAVLQKLHAGVSLVEIETLLRVNVDQFCGIEIEEFPAQIAQVALWLTDHQMNQQVSEAFGQYFARIPLTKSANIIHGNALRIHWETTFPDVNYILGNPPFVGAKYMDDLQRADARAVFSGIDNAGLLDLVTAWHVKATRYMQLFPRTHSAFVSTNSITQGEQVGALWGWMLAQGIKIHFAHRTFSWTNEARGKAAVHCVIIGFGLGDVPEKTIFVYENIKGEAHAVKAANINPYLVDAPDTIVISRMSPLSAAPAIANGSIPADGGNLILEPGERDQLLTIEPQVALWLRPYLGGEGFLNGNMRYCLWLVDCPPQILRTMPSVLARVEGVRNMRRASAKVATQVKANTPTLFTENRQPTSGRYLALPRTSSENRRYIPIGYLDHHIVAANDLQFIPNASPYHFGIVSSALHMAWMRITSGRLESRYRYSVKCTYNTFPWPSPDDKQRAAIETAAQGVIDARAAHPDATLADLYDPLTMPPDLVKAHQKLDRAVDAAYGVKSFANEAERVAFLFRRYQELVAPLAEEMEKKTKKSRKRVQKPLEKE
ncbi:class I SAM-dependent DNA methyltransferase [Chrysiogenes arsenatis]|uniref:class I SAM-dependent DNA methyltransferase n=1 Tax=Chrysiogenes arsenatis TaxID=309797 RepID=UPI00041AF94A|nr:DNA methyltransferase [Chrysiogenes arsenatis]